MYQLKTFEFKASDISVITKSPLKGEDITLDNIRQLGAETHGSIVICYPSDKEYLKTIKVKCLVFCTENTVVNNNKLSFIITPDPAVAFYRFINEFLVTETSYWYSEVVSVSSAGFPGVLFGYNIKIGKNVIIAPQSRIGSGCTIGNNVVIRSNVELGDNCIIKDNTTIGSEGFGFVTSDEGLIHIPKIGNIKIGNNVIIGACCSIEKPSLGSTIIHDHVKIDDLVQIGQNQQIGENTIITTGFKAEGGVKIGKNTFIGMGVTIISGKITVGDNCLIGAGTILTKSIGDNKVAYSKNQLIINEVTDKLEQILKNPKN